VALAKILPTSGGLSRHLQAMKGFPVTIRTLDPPLHEFLPNTEEHSASSPTSSGSRRQDRQPRERAARIQSDARLPRLPPRNQVSGITAMQVRAIFEAAAQAVQEDSGFVRNHDPACRIQEGARSAGGHCPRGRSRRAVGKKVKLHYAVGTMIEIPRGALTADEIARPRNSSALHKRLTRRAGHEPRRFRLVPAPIRSRDFQAQPVRLDRPGGVASS